MECDICNKTTKEYYILFYKLFNPALLSKGGARLDWRARTSRCSLWRIKMKELTWIQWNSSTINTRKYCTYLSCTPRVTHGWICSVYLEKKEKKETTWQNVHSDCYIGLCAHKHTYALTRLRAHTTTTRAAAQWVLGIGLIFHDESRRFEYCHKRCYIIFNEHKWKSYGHNILNIEYQCLCRSKTRV